MTDADPHEDVVPTTPVPALRTGWAPLLARLSMGLLLFEAVSGLGITFLPFHAAIQWSVMVHTLLGVALLLPLAWYCAAHWLDYRRHPMSQSVILGQLGMVALFVCSLSGAVVTVQGLFLTQTSPVWRQVHLISTFATLGLLLPHLALAILKARRGGDGREVRRYGIGVVWPLAAGAAMIGAGAWLYSGPEYHNAFPEDYVFLYGKDRPFAPSLARTDTGGAFDSRSLAGSRSCGTSGCHEQILEEWLPSAHRYAAMDTIFQGIQTVMAQQNGPESTRYCGGCHDPISLFSGTKNIFAEDLTSLHGHQEGVSCLACHAIRETDVKGNASYVATQPMEYLWQWETNFLGRLARDFLIRTYPAEHGALSKRMFKKPEYCAACHKQFIDQEVNRVGWVQLQNQYDNWHASHWNHPGDPRRTLECRECHMPLVASRDPAAGDASDYNRDPKDGKHRSHRFIASNQLMPQILKLEGWEEQVRLTEKWLRGEFEVREIEEKWPPGPIVKISMEVPESVAAGESFPLRVVMASNKVGHDFPTGPLDIIQSWLEIEVADSNGRVLFASGRRDEKNFIEPGSFLFKAEPVDQHGNLIDRHNLWEMVGVRYRRALFPGYSDSVQFLIDCSGMQVSGQKASPEQEVVIPAPSEAGTYQVTASLQYRKVDQFLLNFLFGETNLITSPVSELARVTGQVSVLPKADEARSTRVLSHAD